MRAYEFIMEVALKTTELNMVIDLFTSGQSLTSISKKMGIPIETFRHHLAKLPNYEELKQKHRENSTFWTQEKIDHLVNSYRYGMPIKEISERMGISTAAIKKKLASMENINDLRAEHDKNSVFRVNFDKEQGDNIINMYINGIAPYNIAEKMNVSGNTILKFLQSQRNFKTLKSKHESNITYKRIWKPEEISDIVEKYSSGITIGELAKAFNASNDGIKGLLSKQPNFEELKANNIKNSKVFINWTPELVQNIVDMYTRGDTIESISKATNISIAVVHSKLKSQPNFNELYMQHNQNAKHIFKWTEDKIKEVLDMYASGKTYIYIANHYNLSDTPIKRIVQSQPNYAELKRIHDSNMRAKS